MEELEELDERQLAILKNAIKREISTSPEIHKVLRDKFAPVRVRMAQQRRGQKNPGDP